VKSSAVREFAIQRRMDEDGDELSGEKRENAQLRAAG
jgi:hypothetical protein